MTMTNKKTGDASAELSISSDRDHLEDSFPSALLEFINVSRLECLHPSQRREEYPEESLATGALVGHSGRLETQDGVNSTQQRTGQTATRTHTRSGQ